MGDQKLIQKCGKRAGRTRRRGYQYSVALAQLVLGSSTPEQLSQTGELSVYRGAIGDLTELCDLWEPFTFWFNIVTP